MNNKIVQNKIRKVIFSIIGLMMISQVSFAQGSGWEMVWSESSELGTVKAFSFVEGTNLLWETGYAGLFDGRILKTTDGGATWVELSFVIPEYIWGISFVDEDTGFAAGTDGSIYKTTNGGNSWSQVYYNSGHVFNKVAFKDANNGVAVGYPNIYTNDGGATWTTGSYDYNYWSLDYSEGDEYYVVEAFTGSIAHTVDNGETYVEAHNTDWDLTICVNFFDANTGIVGGEAGKVLVTSDGGSSWQEQSISSVEILAVGWFDADTVWASGDGVFKSTDKGVTWVQDTTIFLSGLYNRELFVTGMNTICVAGSMIGQSNAKQIWRKVGPPPIGADFEAEPEVVCTGSSVDFTDISVGVIDSWTWTFEGGTPATSTDQNPSVTYSAAGEYDVKLVVTVGGISDSLTKTNYVSAVLLPAKANTPLGETEVCTGQIVEFTVDEVLYAQDYEWQILPTDAGVLNSEMNTATLEVSDTWTGDYVVYARATNVCGFGDWSDGIEGTIYLSPSEFILEGGGGYCMGGDGVEVTLSGSEVDIDYELFLDGATTGIIVEGTGSELSFGLLTEAGFYEAQANSDHCTSFMQEQVLVEVYPNPAEPVISGEAMACDFSTETYEVINTEGNIFTWVVTGGDIAEGQGTNMVTVNWNGVGNGTLIVEEETSDGCSATSEQFDVVIDDCTGIGEDEANSLSIYPNPAKDFLNITLNSTTSIAVIYVYDITGQVALKEEFSNNGGKHQINISHLTNGTYLVKVQTGGKVLSSKLFMKN